ncbi:MAG: hypothetical protein IT460_10525 [Planctomycetes bacterium]|nr:hypothetical protein [Planctomycetota bacterium]
MALEHDPQPSVLSALDDAIERADLFIADITPRRASGIDRSQSAATAPLLWNPNVMYEIGRAQQARAPLFVICDAQFNPKLSGVPLPFDIAALSIHWYEFSPNGLISLEEQLLAWLQSGLIDRFVTAKVFTRDARRIHDEISGWNSGENRQFLPLITAITDMLLETATEVRAYMMRGRPFKFRPASPSSLIDRLFADTIARMEAGDSYDAISTLNFWSELGPSSRFFSASRHALGKGVTVRRLFLVPSATDKRGDDWRRHAAAALVAHGELLRAHPKGYEVKCLPRDEGVKNDDPAHCGICRFARAGDPVVRAFRPHYRKSESGGPTSSYTLIGIDYEVNADAREAEFQRLWDDPRSVSLAAYSKALSEGEGGAVPS